MQRDEESSEGWALGTDQELEALAAECGLPNAHNVTKDTDGGMAVSTLRLMQHCRRYYNRYFGQADAAARMPETSASSEEDEAELEMLMRLQRPTPYHCITWEHLGEESDTRASRMWASFVHQLMLAGNIVPDKTYKMRFPQEDTRLDGVDLGVQMRLMRRHGDYKMLKGGEMPGGKVACWLQRLYRPRVPKLVGVWYNMSAGKWPIADRRKPQRRTMQEEQEDQVEVTGSDFLVPAAYPSSSYVCPQSDPGGMGGGCAVIGMPQGTGPEQLDLAVQADVRTLQGGGMLEQNGRGQGAVTWNVLPAAMSSAVAAYMQNELHLGQVL
jgi:hypothetical protein